MKFTVINKLDFDEKGNLLKSGIWVVLNSKDEKIEIIVTELSQSIVGPNFGIYPDSESKDIRLYNNLKLIKTYANPFSKNDLLLWILNNCS